jgi:hypothetical protein
LAGVGSGRRRRPGRTYSYDPDEPNDGEFIITAWNRAKTWVSVVVQVDNGGNTIWETDRFGPNDYRQGGVLMAPYFGQTVKIVRWAPGDGGGDIVFTMPLQGSLSIDLSAVPG